MSKRPFNPVQAFVAVIGSDGSRFMQEGHFYGTAPLYTLIDFPGSAAVGTGIRGDTALNAGVAAVDGVVVTAAPGAEKVLGGTAPKEPLPVYLMEQLEALDLPALRVIGDQYGVKGRSKVDLVADVMEAQAKAAAE
jgi:hypothetical protein